MAHERRGHQRAVHVLAAVDDFDDRPADPLRGDRRRGGLTVVHDRGRRWGTARPAAAARLPDAPARRARRGRATSASVPPGAPRRARRGRRRRRGLRTAPRPRRGRRSRRPPRQRRPPTPPASPRPFARPGATGRASTLASSTAGQATSTGPRRHAASRIASGSSDGVVRSTPPPRSRTEAASAWIGAGTTVPERRAEGTPRTAAGGDEATRNGRTRPAPQRSEAHRTMPSMARSGPRPVTLAIGLRSSTGVPSATGDSRTTHPPTRRPASGTRTRSPRRTSSPSGTT